MPSSANLASTASIERVTEMTRLQNQFNRVVFPDWETRGLAWPRAIWMECSEMMERRPWKWWKASHTPEDRIQQQIELVDIWHFIMSQELENGRTADEITKAFFSGQRTTGAAGAGDRDVSPPDEACDDLIEWLAHEALTVQRGIPQPDGHQMVQIFGLLCLVYDLSLNGLFALYVGKNALNHFRAQNGYKSGTYRKNWSDGREDNSHLEDIMGQARGAGIAPAELMDYALSHLETRYRV